MSKSITLAAVGLSCLFAIPLLFSCQKSNSNKTGTKTDTTGGNSTGIDTPAPKKYYITTLAGTGQAGFVNGPDTLAQCKRQLYVEEPVVRKNVAAAEGRNKAGCFVGRAAV